jgi:hypothetical protein
MKKENWEVRAVPRLCLSTEEKELEKNCIFLTMSLCLVKKEND